LTPTHDKTLEEIAMSSKVARLHAVGERIEAMKTKIENAARHGEQALLAELDAVRQRLHHLKEQTEQGRANLERGAQQNVAGTKESVASSTERHEVSDLNARADRVEPGVDGNDYLVPAIYMGDFQQCLSRDLTEFVDDKAVRLYAYHRTEVAP
jgi:hypothetical protein